MGTVGVIGAGIAGLTAAYHAAKHGADVIVIEATDRAGGLIRSEHAEGYLVEHGPNSLRAATPALSRVISELGLDAERIPARRAAETRYVVRDQEPKPLPSSPVSFLTTDLLSARAKLRILAEPFIRAGVGPDESVASFVSRRLGSEVLDYAVNPFVGGIFAGDPDALSIKHAFARLFDLEREHGSLFKGMVRGLLSRRKNSTIPHSAPEEASAEAPPVKADTGIFSFQKGLQTLPDALAATLGDRIELNTTVQAMRSSDEGWTLTVQVPSGDREEVSVDAVICTAPLHRLGSIDFDTPLDLAPLVRTEYPAVSVVALGFPRAAVAHPLDGFGMLVPAVERSFHVLGTVFSSSVFPDRTPAGHVLLTTFVGGARHPSLGRASFDTLKRIVMRDLGILLGISGPPSFARHVLWERAIPQYTLGYGKVKAQVNRLEQEHPGLYFAGNYRQGISVGDAMESGQQAAEQALKRVKEVPA